MKRIGLDVGGTFTDVILMDPVTGAARSLYGVVVAVAGGKIDELATEQLRVRRAQP